jgi:hypothetical protein
MQRTLADLRATGALTVTPRFPFTHPANAILLRGLRGSTCHNRGSAGDNRGIGRELRSRAKDEREVLRIARDDQPREAAVRHWPQ